MKNVVIYIDYENIHKIVVNRNENLLRLGFFEKLRKWCEKNELRVLDIKVYCNFDIKDLYESYHQTKLQEYGVETFHTSNKGKNYADLKISTDLLEELYENSNVDGFILISNDKDMTPLIKAIKRYKQFIYLITDDNNYDKSLNNFPDKHIMLSEIIKIGDVDVLIDDVKDEIVESLHKYSLKKLTEFNSGSGYNPHTGLEYYIGKTHSYFKIPKYEFLNLLKILYEEKKLCLYNYSSNGKSYVGLIVNSLKNDFISNKVFQETDVKNNFDFDILINKLYLEYKSN